MSAVSTKCSKINTFNDGNKIPSLGLGTWKSADEDVYESVKHALKVGYKHIDTAAAYGNEEAIGRAIKDSGVPRDQIFVTTKVWANQTHDPTGAIKESLEKLQLDHVDLYLMHYPLLLNPEGTPARVPMLENGQRDVIADWDFVDGYVQMQNLVKSGKTRSIGVSNFSVRNLKKLLSSPEVTMTPVVNQVECHPYLPQFELNKFCLGQNIHLEAYSPLGSNGSPLIKDETLIDLSEKYDVAPSTIIISWLVSRHIIPLPKSINPSRVHQNLHILELDPEDVEIINRISDRHTKRYVDYDWSPINLFEED